VRKLAVLAKDTFMSSQKIKVAELAFRLFGLW
jgi:hypothetical protein